MQPGTIKIRHSAKYLNKYQKITFKLPNCTRPQLTTRAKPQNTLLCVRGARLSKFFKLSCFIADGEGRFRPLSVTKEFWIPASAGKTEGLLGQAEFAFWEKAPDVNPEDLLPAPAPERSQFFL